MARKANRSKKNKLVLDAAPERRIVHPKWVRFACRPGPHLHADFQTIETTAKNRYYNNSKNTEILAEYYALERYEFERQLRQVKWYWASILFEIIWLVGLVWFMAWPIIRKMHCWHAVIRLGLMPIGLFLPMFLGYAQYTFTSCFPGGGILYPFILIRFKGGSMNSWDETILEYVPQIFEPLSQGIGTPLAVTGFGAPGPTSILLIGLEISLIITGVITLMRLFKKEFFKKIRNKTGWFL